MWQIAHHIAYRHLVLAAQAGHAHHIPVAHVTSDRPRSQAGYEPGVSVFADPSFFARIANHTTGEFPVFSPSPGSVPQGRRRHVARQHDRTASPSEQRNALREAIAAVWDRLDSASRTALELQTGSEWIAFWTENFGEYVEDARTLRRLAQLYGVTDEHVAKSAKGIEQRVMERFPDAQHEVRFLISMMKRSHRAAIRFAQKEVADKDRETDAGLAQDFNFWTEWFSICMSQLSFIADPGEGEEAIAAQQDVLNQIFEMARSAAIEVNHAAMEAANLRRDERKVEGETDVSLPTMQIEDGDLVDVEMSIRRFEAGAQ